MISPYWLGLHEVVVTEPVQPDPSEVAWHDWLTESELTDPSGIGSSFRMLVRRSTDIALCRCGRERCELWCPLLEFVFRGSASCGGERVVGTTSSRAAS